MNDKLYYVEGQDGRVLGPMTLAQALEGVAAQAIAETARVCEVGGQSWIGLHQVTTVQAQRPQTAPPAPPTPAPHAAASTQQLEYIPRYTRDKESMPVRTVAIAATALLLPVFALVLHTTTSSETPVGGPSMTTAAVSHPGSSLPTLEGALRPATHTTARNDRLSAPAPAPRITAQERVAARLEDVRRALEVRDYDDARYLLRESNRALGHDPDFSRVFTLQAGIIDYEEGRFEDALGKFETLPGGTSFDVVGPVPVSPSGWRGFSHLAMGDPKAAVRAFDRVPASGNRAQYAVAQLWEGVALANLGMRDMAIRTWRDIPRRAGEDPDPVARVAVRSAEYLAGDLLVEKYLEDVAFLEGFENDMHFFLGFAALMESMEDIARGHYTRSVDATQGREFPFHLARAELARLD
ncbi:MAG: hypothetical protein QF819_04900 [Gemmatimonadota bacterium]|jgi:hypothetical protein|nr:hypothetical protein [Gemmatimonadota bacterium]MDP6529711.1 hypothetical protein [Gemmatimonadota bacterium]MDP6802498.1 hypothetical protein [Gemmatimonadota bacterium]MDP7030945.1 hypothetical protein [Gemmatimonadota bacterium]